VAALRKLRVAGDAELIEYALANGLAHRAMTYVGVSQPEEGEKVAVYASLTPAHPR